MGRGVAAEPNIGDAEVVGIGYVDCVKLLVKGSNANRGDFGVVRGVVQMGTGFADAHAEGAGVVDG